MTKRTPAQEQASDDMEPLLTLDDYLKKAAKHYGLVASFKYEANGSPALLEPKKASEWDTVFEEQTRRVYK